MEFNFLDERKFHRGFLDDKLIDISLLQHTGGFGYTAGEWQIFSLKFGTPNSGAHELKLAPAGEEQVMNQDYFYLSDDSGAVGYSLPQENWNRLGIAAVWG